MVTWIGKIMKDEYIINNNLKDIEVLDQPLAVLTYAKMIHGQADYDFVDRPYGRKDYQLLYIKKGLLEVYNGNKSTMYGKNTLLFLRPGVPQKRRVIVDKEETVCYYVHFSGSDVEKYLNAYGITEPVMNFNEALKPFEDIINRMEAGKNSLHHQELCDLLLQELFVFLSDAIKQNTFKGTSSFKDLLTLMDQTCTKNHPISFYADQIHFSEVYFIRFFKKAMGISPHKYIMDKKIEKSLPLLLYSKDSIKTISEKLGFSNQHYFSKVFSDKYKLSPSEYRNA